MEGVEIVVMGLNFIVEYKSWFYKSCFFWKMSNINCNKYGYIFLVKSWLCEIKVVIDIVFGW